MTPTTQELPGLELVELGPTFVVDSVALAPRSGNGPVTVESCSKALVRITKIKDAVRYWRGDVMNLAETLFKEEGSQLLDADLMDEQEAKDECLVSGKVGPVARSHSPSWDHSKAVVRLPEPEQFEWLDRARSEDWSARKLASEIAQSKAKGKTVMKFWLIVECGTEARMEKLAAELVPKGYNVKRQEKLRKVAKEKKGPVTAQRKHKGAPKMNTRKRTPR